MKYRILLLGALIAYLPAVSYAQVLLSEIAWMGNDTDASAEWIELYNFSNTPTDLSGWSLSSEDGALSINLSGTLSPHGVGTLERESDSVLPSITALLTYNGELSDAGTTINLTNSEGTIVDRAIGGANWSSVGGRNALPKKTAQRTRMGTWITAAATPGLENTQVNDPVPEPEVLATSTSSSTPILGATISSSRRGGGGSSARKNTEFSVSIIASTTVYVGKPNNFKALTSRLDRSQEIALRHYWNFGDMHTSTGTKVTHEFEFPGEYIVMLESSTTKKQNLGRLDVKVLPHALTLATTTEGNIIIKNISEEEFKLDGYSIVGEGYKFIFPKNSLIMPKANITIGKDKLGKTVTLQLLDQEKFAITSLQLYKQ